MKKTKNPYKGFEKFVLRTPLLSLSAYKKLTEEDVVEEKLIRELCQNVTIQEAVFLASPSLFFELKKWLEGEITDQKESEKLIFSILKYLSRMSSRCTPFGIFAGCSVGKFDYNSRIELSSSDQNKRHTRLDMNYLVALSQDLVKNESIRKQLLFFPNTSIYKAGDFLRYVEYHHDKNSRRHHHIVAVNHSEYLEQILQKSKEGALLKDLLLLLVDDEITEEEASAFIEELIDNQVLISELEPSVSGDEFLPKIQSVLQKLEGVEELLAIINQIHQEIHVIDQTLQNPISRYTDLSELIKKLGTGYELKYLFQTDMILETNHNVLQKEILQKAKKCLAFLNKISPKVDIETPMQSFKNAFYERYENREVSLSNALDIEIGVGYLQNQGTGDVTPLVDDLILPLKNENREVKNIKWTRTHAILHEKLQEVHHNQEYVMKLTDEDFKDFEVTWTDLPDTISSMIEIITEDGEQKIVMTGAGGSSAANILGRFCHGDSELNTHTNSIIEKETIINKDKILAEIVHLPESRVGNILMRPAFRAFEIPYLATSSVEPNKQIDISDLMVSMPNHKKMILRSKKHKKEVIPHLTNAHNYSANALPIYHFLCDMQTQDLRSSIGFNWGGLADQYKFLPRVIYEDIIISRAVWNFKKVDLEPFLKLFYNEKKLLSAISDWRDVYQIPQYVSLIDGDNKLLINLRNITSIQMLLHTIKNRTQIKFSEFLFTEKGIVTCDNDDYTNQIVVSFFNEGKLK